MRAGQAPEPADDGEGCLACRLVDIEDSGRKRR
jgi:hypothetical protein